MGVARLTQAQRTALSDRRMRDSAIELIVAQGTTAMSLKQVGEAAGYSRGLASQRFGSKDGLFSFIVRSVGEDWLAKLKQATQGRSGYGALCAATDEHLRFCLDDPTHVRAFYILWFESVTPASQLNAVISHIHQRRFHDVVSWIRDAQPAGASPVLDAEAVAAQFCASIIGIVYTWLAQPNDAAKVRQLHDDLKKSMKLCLQEEDSHV